MDIFSHGLWGAAAAQITNETHVVHPRRVNPWWAMWWGFFPDLFAFAPAFIWIWGGQLFGFVEPASVPRFNSDNPQAFQQLPIAHLASELYNYSHSLVIFSVVAGMVLLIRYLQNPQRSFRILVPWSMGGWLLHILSDIPTHTYDFYPTPVFWPLLEWKFNGFRWGQSWFIVTNYAILFSLFIILYVIRRKKS